MSKESANVSSKNLKSNLEVRNTAFNLQRNSVEKFQFDHSQITEILQSVNECNIIRYASYRTASKIQVLQKYLSMQNVSLELIAGIFERHRLSVTENSITLDIHEVEDVLFDIYFAAKKDGNGNYKAELATKLAANFIFKIFHKNHEDNILVFSVKLFLTLLNSGKLEEKYGYLFHQLADHNACLSPAALFTLLSNMSKIMEIIGESVAYGTHLIDSTIDDCFRESKGCLGVTEAEFARWLMEDPIYLTWISTLSRIKSAENIIHNTACSSCKLNPITGPRYSCLRCVGFHQCQSCFLHGKTSGKHKLKHPIREYCAKTSNKEVTKLIVELIRNKLMLCPTRSVMRVVQDTSFDIDINHNKPLDNISMRNTIKRRICMDPQSELQNIISHLEEENKQLQAELKELGGAKVERLQQHRIAIQSQLERLKLLKNHLFEKCPPSLNLLQSTPMVFQSAPRVSSLPPAFELSPINCRSADDNNDNKLIKEKSTTSPKSVNESTVNECANDSRIELSTWIGGGKSDFSSRDSRFSKWLDSRQENNKRYNFEERASAVDDNFTFAGSCNYIPRDSQLYSLQPIDKQSQHSSLQNIQGDLNEILDRLQNMVANDCLLDDTFSVDSNCELKRAATEMEDLLTGLIEGMESRKGKLTTIV